MNIFSKSPKLCTFPWSIGNNAQLANNKNNWNPRALWNVTCLCVNFTRGVGQEKVLAFGSKAMWF